MASVRLAVAAVILAIAGEQVLVRAQTVDQAAPPTAAVLRDAPKLPPTSGDAEGPDVFLLPDREGELRRVLGYRYEDFILAWRAERDGKAPAGQHWSLENLTLTGKASDGSASVTIRAEVRLQGAGWASVPLALPELIVDEARVDGGDANDYVAFDAKTGGYVAWLHGKAAERRTVVLEGALPIASDGGRQRVTVELPAAVSSKVSFDAAAAVEVESPTGAMAVSAKPDSDFDAAKRQPDQPTTIELDGVRGQLTLAWDRGDASATAPATAALDATVETVLTVDPNRLSYDATVELNPYGRPLHRVWIRLPRGAILNAGPGSPAYDATTLGAPAAARRAAAERQIVEIRFHEPTTIPTVVRLRAAQAARGSDPPTAEMIQDAGPIEVLGALRQMGSIALKLSDQLHAHFQPVGRIEQIETRDLPEALRGQSPLAAFAMSDAAWKLSIHTQRRVRRIRVSPHYKLYFGADGTKLDATLDYQITGGRVFELRVGVAGWELADQLIESGGAVDLNELHVTSEGELILPLKDPDVQQVHLQLAMQRPGILGPQSVPLLEPKGGSVMNGDITIASVDAWRVAVDLKKSAGVAALADNDSEQAASEFARDDSASAAESATTKLETVLPQCVISADVTRKPRQLAIASTTAVKVDDLRVVVDQAIDYQVRFQPLEELTVVAPSSLLGNGEFSASIDGRALPMGAIDVEPLEQPLRDGGGTSLRMVLHLPRPTLGPVKLDLHSEWPVDSAQATGASPVLLPLAVPEQRSTSSLVATDQEDFRFNLWPGSESTWRRDADASLPSEPGGVLRLTARSPVADLPLRLEHTHRTEAIDARLEAVWAQTWIAAGRRQDRFAFRVRTADKQLRVALPETWLNQPVEVLIDGEPASHERLTGGNLVVTLPGASLLGSAVGPRRTTLELRAQSPVELSWRDNVSLMLPVVEAERAQTPFYWLAVLPGTYASIGTPVGLSGEYRVGWRDGSWGRQPAASQDDLERWIKASSAAAPAPSTSQYVFSGLETPERASLAVVRQTWLVVAGALVALGVGLAAIATPLARSRAFWLAIAAAVGAVTINYPEALITLGQAAGAGVALTLAAVVIRRIVDGPRPRVSPTSTSLGPGSFVTHASTTQSWAAEPRSSSARATAASGLQATGARP